MTTLIGMCPSSKHDTQFTLDGELVDKRHTFRGFSVSLIYWNFTDGTWRLKMYGNEVHNSGT